MLSGVYKADAAAARAKAPRGVLPEDWRSVLCDVILYIIFSDRYCVTLYYTLFFRLHYFSFFQGITNIFLWQFFFLTFYRDRFLRG